LPDTAVVPAKALPAKSRKATPTQSARLIILLKFEFFHDLLETIGVTSFNCVDPRRNSAFS
jgi:hypothetical protein